MIKMVNMITERWVVISSLWLRWAGLVDVVSVLLSPLGPNISTHPWSTSLSIRCAVGIYIFIGC